MDKLAKSFFMVVLLIAITNNILGQDIMKIERPQYTVAADKLTEKFFKEYNKQDYKKIWSLCGNIMKKEANFDMVASFLKNVHINFGIFLYFKKIDDTNYQKHTTKLMDVQIYNENNDKKGLSDYIYIAIFEKGECYFENMISKEKDKYKIQGFRFSTKPELVYYEEGKKSK